MSTKISYRPTAGYAFVSTKRFPKSPEIQVIGKDEFAGASFVGTAIIDDAECCAFRLGRRYVFQMAHCCEQIELSYSQFDESDVDRSGQFPRVWISSYDKELVYNPPKWMQAGLQQTATGYGLRLNSGYSIHFEGRLRRIYVTCYSNNGTAWFTYRGERIIVD